jgi:hypothetical protein
MSSEPSAIATSAAPPRVTHAERATGPASIRARVGGYAVDMVILAAITMLVSIGTLFLFLWATDMAEQDLSTAKTVLCLMPLFIGVPVVWSALNIWLLMSRAQTGGQYVAALRLQPESSAAMTMRTALAWWFCGNPLLFNWLMTGIAGFPLLLVSLLAPSDIALAIPIFVTLLCVALPIVALVSALRDPANRALHDKIAGVAVVPA